MALMNYIIRKITTSIMNKWNNDRNDPYISREVWLSQLPAERLEKMLCLALVLMIVILYGLVLCIAQVWHILRSRKRRRVINRTQS